MKHATKKPKPPISEAPKVRIPEELLAALDREAARAFPGAGLSRIQIVGLALREWLGARKAQS